MPTVPFGGYDPDLLAQLQPTKATQLLAKLTTTPRSDAYTMPSGPTRYPDPLRRPPKRQKPRID